jgi:anti-sigma B factor antagonist
MNFTLNQTENIAIIASGVERLNALNVQELKEMLFQLQKSGVNHVVLDMSATRYCDSSGLSAILLANRICKEASGKFILCGLQENVEKLIQMAQLDKVLTVTKNQQQANEAIAE